MYTQPCLYTQRWEGGSGEMPALSRFPGKHPTPPGGLQEKKKPKTAPQDPLPHGRSPRSSWHLKSHFSPILSYFGCFFPLSSPDVLCSSHPNGAVGGCVHGSSASLARKGSLGQRRELLFWAYYWILVVLPFFCFLFHVFLPSSPELGRAGSDSAALPE